MRPYQYRCNDKSIVTPIFKQWIVTPLIRFISWGIPANIITILSNGFVYLALYLALHSGPVIDTFTRLTVALCLLIYLIGDHLDGMQAKRTRTGSALGEFCDHYLDAFNNGIIVFTMLFIFQVTNPFIIALVIVASYLAHLSVFYEQFKTGWLTFEKMGSLEGVLVAVAAISLSCIEKINDALLIKIFLGCSGYELLMLVSAAGAFITFFTTWKRTPEVKYGFWLFIVLLVVMTALCVGHFSNIEMFVILTLYASLYIGRIMQGHLIDGVERKPDLIAPLLLMLGFLLPIDFITEYTFWIIASYLILCIGYLIVSVFSILKVYWVWVNTKK